jgi:hypothetical protein
MDISISSLPMSIQTQLPVSIRTHKDVYNLEDLPPIIRNIISDYLEKVGDIQYNIVFDTTPQVSEYGDFSTIENIRVLILEYLKNYFMTYEEDYPFDPYFGSKLKKYLQVRDTSLQQTLISSEVQSIVNVLSADLGARIEIEDIKIYSVAENARQEYQISIKVRINDILSAIEL